MLHLGALQLILIGGLAAAGTTAGAVVLTTSGPLAGRGREVQQAAATNTPRSTATVAPASATTAPATPAPAATRMAPDHVIAPDATFDFSQLPAVNQSGWKTISGPTGALTVQVPPDWVVLASTLKDASGKVVGDALSAYKPLGKQVDVGDATPGWVKVDLSTSPTQVPTSNGDEVPRRIVPLTRVLNGRTISLSAIQFGRLTRFPNILGEVVFLPSQRGTSGLYLSGAAWAWLPATAADVATARAVMESAVVK